ncbi:MAG: outer membrane protein assembly factor BamB family protein [Marmoricola sp.]
MRAHRRWGVAAVVATLGVGGMVAGCADGPSAACSSAAVGAGQVPPVFAATDAPVVRNDAHLARLVAEVRASHLGRVLGAVGYDQRQWLRSAAVSGGFATWTADNAVIGFRDTDGRVRWGLRQSRDPQAWATTDDRVLDLDLRPGRSARIASYNARTGAMAWCADVGTATHYGDPLTVAPGAGGSTWVVTAGPTLAKVDASGRATKPQALSGADRAAYVRQIGSLLIVGGRASHLLAAPDPKAARPRADQPAVIAFDAQSLQPRWRWGSGLTAHVVGETGGLLLVEVARPQGSDVAAVDLTGHQRWATKLPGTTTPDMIIDSRTHTLVVRTARSVSGYDAITGRLRWTRTLGAVFPDGFDLAAQARLGDRILLATKQALVALDPATGRTRDYPLPTDGSGTYWPYEVVVSGPSLILETNAGAVLVSDLPGSG